MAQIVCLHSYRRGTGKTSLTVNLATLMALAGKKVAIIDAALQAPSTQFFFDLGQTEIRCFFNDFLDGRCELETVLYDVTPFLKAEIAGQLFLAPTNTNYKESIAAKSNLNVDQLEDSIARLIEKFSLDIVLMDTSAGMKDDALIPLVVSDIVIEILRLDQQDYQGTAVLTEIAQKLDIPRVLLIANIVSTSHDHAIVKQEIEKLYQLDVAGVIPVSEDMLALPDGEIFVLNFPAHPITHTLQNLAAKIV
jgi:MinD-like ATPase involved in chromosome partitioning or flagellar assembly